MNEDQTTNNETAETGSQAAEPSEDETSPKAPETVKNKRKPLKKLLIALAAMLGVLAALCGGFLLRLRLPFFTEVGEPVSLGLVGRLPAGILEPSDELAAIGTSVQGKYTIPARLLGSFDTQLNIVVRDTIPPEFTTRELRVMPDHPRLTADDFIVSCNDRTKVAFAFASPPSLSAGGSTAVTIIAADEGGNTARRTVSLTIDPSLAGITAELGSSQTQIESRLTALAENCRIEDFDPKAIGEYFVSSDDTLFSLRIVDTVPPSASARDIDLLVGANFVGSELWTLVDDVKDESEVIISVDGLELDKPGDRTVELLLTDSAGNTTELTSKLRIHNIPSRITVEAGIVTSELLDRLLAGCTENIPTADPQFEASRLRLGANELILHGEYSDIVITVNVEDTTAPTLELRDLETDRGLLPSPESFVSYCLDATAVHYDYPDLPDVATPGRASVTVCATDAAGNSTLANAMLTVVADTTPPVIYGVTNLYAYEGDSISYRSGVYAEDASDGRVTVRVDSSKVNTSVAGNYRITYTAADLSGNVATETAIITIRKVTQATLDECADRILDQMITAYMSDREIALAIYDWCRENLKYSTATGYLMGYYYKAAYSGYRLGYGNCYTYYAIARSLLTRAGIKNQMIQRNSTSRPHYWNLVQIDGSWYHFDTCPQPAPHNDGCFLLTDAEVAEYSRSKEPGYYSFRANYYPATP